MNTGRIVAVGPWSAPNTTLLGSALAKAWPVEQTASFEGLLNAIDVADRERASRASGGVDNVEQPLPPRNRPG